MSNKRKSKKRSDTTQTHEATCKRCGRCCRIKFQDNDGTIVALGLHCEFFDPKTNLCTIYATRHEDKMRLVNRHCGTVEDGIKDGYFPEDCPYVKNIKGYKCIVGKWL